MTKKELILSNALSLFAKDGFNAVATSKIAKAAGVSEGLIFKHYKNKKGLLEAIVGELEGKIYELTKPVFEEENPSLIIEKSILGLLQIDESDYDFWKLQFKLKTDDSYDTQDKIQPFIDHLEKAFSKLNYKNPKLEAQLLFEIMDSALRRLVNGKLEHKEGYVRFLLEKYRGS